MYVIIINNRKRCGINSGSLNTNIRIYACKKFPKINAYYIVNSENYTFLDQK